MERPTPEEHRKFELITREFISLVYSDTYGYFTIYGKNGDSQHGCDVKDQRGRVIVQCKCYSNANKRFFDELHGDYSDACKHFHAMERFVICTTISRSTDVNDKLQSMQGSNERQIPIEVYFWEDINDRMLSHGSDNTSYAEQFEEPLFLHKGNPNVCLKNLFVPQKYSEGRGPKGNPWIFNDLYDRIARFVSDPDKLLIIEGDAGCGKTSLVQSLCYHDREGDELAKKTLGGRPLVTVRLRDINKDLISENRGLMPSIAAYLGVEASRDTERITELNKRFPHAVLILDGFDELCIIEGIPYYDRLLSMLSRERLNGWKFIVVSRPNYINVSRSSPDIGGINDIPHASIALMHFDEEKRTEWMERFTDPDKCGGTIEEGMKRFILENSGEGVCDTPLTLYLLTSTDGIDEKTRGNLWRLYNRIFGREIIYRQYEEDHSGAHYAEAAYRLAELVAHEIYLTGNEKLYVDEEQLEDIAEKLPGEYKEKRGELAKHCLSLSCNLKAGERGMAEFYHNNIRDFFLCEMIWRRVNDIYCSKRLDDEGKREALIAFFRDNFRRGALEPKVCGFILLRAEACKEDGTAGFPKCEVKHPLLPVFFGKMLTDGGVYDRLGEKQLLRVIKSILGCVIDFYVPACEPFYEKGKLRLWHNVDDVNESGMFGMLSPADLRKTDLDFADLRRADLTFANLRGADLTGANLTDADLARADLTRADLRSANLMGAHLADADLTGADLTRADLTRADLTRADLTDADLTYADLTGAHLSKADLTDAHLMRANLTGAHLTRADLTYADLTSAHLTRADLTDADLTGAHLTRADLTCADLTRAHLTGAYLTSANLTDAVLRNAVLTDAVLSSTDLMHANLMYADLRGADLKLANLTDAILSGATLPDGYRSNNQDEQVEHLKSLNIIGLII